MTFRGIIYCLLLCVAFTWPVAAESVLPILDTFPRCDYQLVQQFDITKQQSTDAESEPQDQQALLAEVLSIIRRKAAAAGAEAIILQHVDGDKFMINNSVRRRTGSFELRLNARADAIKLCDEDRALALEATPFNERGRRNTMLQTTRVNIPLQFTLESANTANSPRPELETEISLQRGFHGVQPGMMLSELTAVWGPADAEFQLQPQGYRALAYGKQYWLTLHQDKVIAIDTQHPLLSADITHQFNDNASFTHLRWQLNGRFAARTPLPQLKAHYQQQLMPLTDNQFILQQGEQQLQLDFTAYQNIQSGLQEVTLSQLTLRSAQFTTDKQPELTITLSSQQLLKMKPDNPFAQQFWQQTLQPLPSQNQILLGNGKKMTIYNPTVVAVFHQQEITEVQLLSVYKTQAPKELQQTLTALGMPRSKAAFLQQFPDAYDALGKLMYYGDNVEISALYSGKEGYPIDSLTIRFM